jgi:hypothetical protein
MVDFVPSAPEQRLPPLENALARYPEAIGFGVKLELPPLVMDLLPTGWEDAEQHLPGVSRMLVGPPDEAGFSPHSMIVSSALFAADTEFDRTVVFAGVVAEFTAFDDGAATSVEVFANGPVAARLRGTYRDGTLALAAESQYYWFVSGRSAWIVNCVHTWRADGTSDLPGWAEILATVYDGDIRATFAGVSSR